MASPLVSTEVLHKNDRAVINFDLETVITGATTTNIKFRKPNRTTEGTITGSISGTTIVQITLGVGQLDTVGDWTFQAHVILSDGRPLHGRAIYQQVCEVLTGS